MTHWERHETLQEKLQAKGILKLTQKKPKDLEEKEVNEMESKPGNVESEEIKSAPIKKETVESLKSSDKIENLEKVINEKESKDVKESKLNDLDPNKVYAETWTKSKMNSLCKLFNITEFPKTASVKAQPEAIYLPEMRVLNPYEFYDFHANFRPVKSKNTQLHKKDRKVINTGLQKPNIEQPCKGCHCQPLLVDNKKAHQGDADNVVDTKKNSNKNNISESLKTILYEENCTLPKIITNLSISKIQATYIWVSGNDLSVKDRILTKTPKTVRDLPEWTSSYSDGSKNIDHSKDFSLVPKQYYNNPLKPKDGSLLILCDTEDNDNHMSKRASCLKTIKKYIEEEPWFAFAQEYVVLTMDGKPLCANRARETAMAKELAQAHVDACLFAGLPFCALSKQKVPGKWEYEIGPSFGINAADDLWVSRYILKRLAEQKKLQVSFDSKSMQKVTMDIGTKINFSTESMRKDNGIKHILKAVNRLGDHHSILNSIYKQKRRKPFTWAIGGTNVSVRIPKTTAQNGRGYLQDRRPAGDSDPYEIAEAIIKVCLEPSENESNV